MAVAQREAKIVASGSSATEGFGASSPQNTDPARLEKELMQRYPGVAITVLDDGKGGEGAAASSRGSTRTSSRKARPS